MIMLVVYLCLVYYLKDMGLSIVIFINKEDFNDNNTNKLNYLELVYGL